MCVRVIFTETQIVGVFCTGSVSEGASVFVVVVVSCIVQK